MRWRRELYSNMPAVDGERFGEYRARLEKARRKERVIWAREHPVRAFFSLAFALVVGTIIVFGAGLFGWLFLLFGVPWFIVHEWREARRDRRAWKRSQADVDLRRGAGDGTFRV